MSKIGDFAEKLRIKIANRLLGRLEKKKGEQALIDHLNPTATTLAIYGFLKEQGFDARLRMHNMPHGDYDFDCHRWGTGENRPPVCIVLHKDDVYHRTLSTEFAEIALYIDHDLRHTTYDLADPEFFDKLLTDVKTTYDNQV